MNSTGVVYEANEYDSNATNLTRFNSSATVCLKLFPSRCNGSYTSLSPSEYDLLPNLTLVYNSSRHDFGDYAYENGTVAICVGFERKYHISTSSKPHNDMVLKVLILVGFISSVICLFCLIVTYSIFKELRTLPGKNLMSMALSLALSELSLAVRFHRRSKSRLMHSVCYRKSLFLVSLLYCQFGDCISHLFDFWKKYRSETKPTGEHENVHRLLCNNLGYSSPVCSNIFPAGSLRVVPG